MATSRDRSREAFWRRMLRRRAESGMTVAELCASEGVAASAFYYWQRRIRRLDGKSQPQTSDCAGSTSGPTLVPVQILDDRVGPAPVEIVTANGLVIRVGPAATVDHVRRVLTALDTVDNRGPR